PGPHHARPRPLSSCDEHTPPRLVPPVSLQLAAMSVGATRSLLEPLQLGRLQARNRIVFAPHVTNLAAGGLPGERLAAYYQRRAGGGAGVIVLEEAQVHPSSRPYQRAIRGCGPAIVEAYRRLSGRVHEAGALVVAQLGHAGMQGTGHIDKQPLW